MQIYIVRTEVDYEVPIIMGYYSTREAAESRIGVLVDASKEEGDAYPLDVDTLVIEEVTLDQDMAESWM